MKKVLSIIMALTLVFALAVPAFAEENVEGEILGSYTGPRTVIDGWWYDGWLDFSQKVEFSALLIGGEANYIVVVYEDGSDLAEFGYQVGIQTQTDWTMHLFNNSGSSPVGEATKIDYIDGKIYTYFAIDDLLADLEANATNFNLVDNDTSYNWIIGAPSEFPLLAMYVVKADIVPDAPIEETPAVEETPVEDTPVEDTPAEDTPAEETPAETGLALAVVPMIVAAAVVALSKKR